MKNISLILLCLFSISVASGSESPYAGQQHRQVKTLSNADIEGFLSGKGMGYAKAAELNRFPGPKHVLDLRRELDLTQSQFNETTLLFETMRTKAIKLGRLLVDKEGDLDRAFASNAINPESLRSLLSEIAELEGQLRYVHLEAHLKQKSLLSSSQIEQYELSRGYRHHAGKH